MKLAHPTLLAFFAIAGTLSIELETRCASQIKAPVCGTDGISYANTCRAEVAGAVTKFFHILHDSILVCAC